jgi:hypothetical protein
MEKNVFVGMYVQNVRRVWMEGSNEFVGNCYWRSGVGCLETERTVLKERVKMEVNITLVV